MLGSSGVDGTAFALAAATTAPSATEALDLLAASSAVANLRVDRASSLAAHAVAESNVATEGLRNSDHTYDNRFKQYDRQLRLRDLEVEQLQNRVTVLEGLLCRVLAMMLNGTFDAAEVSTYCMLGNQGHSWTDFALDRLDKCSRNSEFDAINSHILLNSGIWSLEQSMV